MQDYMIKLKLCSPLITPLDADTIFGHLCWAIRYIKGNNFIENFLNSFEKSPIFLVSDGFLSDTLPKPILPELNHEDIIVLSEAREIIEILGGRNRNRKSNLLNLLSAIKSIKRTKYIPTDIFLKLADNFSEKSLIIELLKHKNTIINKETESETIEITHNSIDRLTSAVTEKGELFTQNEIFYDKDTVFDIYLRIFDKAYLDLLNDAFNYISHTGYGKDKSTGKGIFSISEKITGINIFDNLNGNYIVSLSPFILTEKPESLFYDLKTKFGKAYGFTSEEYTNNFNPFKKPLLMLTSGSVLRIEKKINNGNILIGELIKGINKDKNIRQYAYCYPLRIKIDQG